MGLNGECYGDGPQEITRPVGGSVDVKITISSSPGFSAIGLKSYVKDLGTGR